MGATVSPFDQPGELPDVYMFFLQTHTAGVDYFTQCNDGYAISPRNEIIHDAAGRSRCTLDEVVVDFGRSRGSFFWGALAETSLQPTASRLES